MDVKYFCGEIHNHFNMVLLIFGVVYMIEEEDGRARGL